MDELLSTKQVSWVLGRSAGTIRELIRDGEIEGVRIPSGFRVPKAGRKLSDHELERLIDAVIATNEQRG